MDSNNECFATLKQTNKKNTKIVTLSGFISIKVKKRKHKSVIKVYVDKKNKTK